MSPSAPPCAPPDFTPRRPRLVLPARACDCHAHVLGPLARYPLADQRVYTPPDCIAADYRRMLDAVGVERAVLVQPSVYGSDTRLLVDALRADPLRLRGVAVLPQVLPQVSAGTVDTIDVSDAELARLHAAGVRGVRLNLVDRADRVESEARLPLALLHALAQRVAPLGWHLELLLHVDEHADELPRLEALGLPLVFGHFGYLSGHRSVGRGADDPGFRALLGLLRQGASWVKLSGPYRLTRSGLPYPECDELAAALRETAPDRLLWGSDWPHVMLRGDMPNDADLVELLASWLPEPDLRQRVLVDNPCVLYGFAR